MQSGSLLPILIPTRTHTFKEVPAICPDAQEGFSWGGSFDREHDAAGEGLRCAVAAW